MEKSKYNDISRLNSIMKELKDLNENKINEYKVKVEEMYKSNKKED
ncbi:hypothetical protein CDFC105_72565 [Clostridioides difficile]|nr:hypothetical protein [Clostridioides difficile]MBY2844680.1 hypothetical protein [Clostridioides difficile]CZR98725.1 hypothetical protein CDFC105_63521 [Clostridioides difficile]CZS07706.1 hypothetical protein CDFC105_72565 [Clostridioides difficile]HBG2117667.1 hypothetical protein [Clostridioides difficile]HBG2167403.1 hypothetical protein [Clostridioides difficile]